MCKTQVKPSQVALQNRERWWPWRGGDAHCCISTPFKKAAATSRHCNNNTTKRAPNLPTPRLPPKRSFIPHPRVPPSHQPPHRIPSLRLSFRNAVRAAILLVRATRARGRLAFLRAPQAPAAHSAADSWRVSARSSQCRLSSPVSLANAPGQHACALAVALVWQRQCESQTGVSVGFQELAQATQTILQKAASPPRPYLRRRRKSAATANPSKLYFHICFFRNRLLVGTTCPHTRSIDLSKPKRK